MPCMLRILGVIVALCIALIREVRGLLGSCWLTPRGAAARGAVMPDAALELLRFLRGARPRLACLCYTSLPPLRAHRPRTSRSCRATAQGCAAVVLLARAALSAEDAWPSWPACTAAVAAAILASRRRYSLCGLGAGLSRMPAGLLAARSSRAGAARSLTPHCHGLPATAEAGGRCSRRVISVSPTVSGSCSQAAARL